ncbi:MAG: D-Ala-D-Ala carboxypeptidase family metallohydrolase [Hyphomicrobiaceae bacterium]
MRPFPNNGRLVASVAMALICVLALTGTSPARAAGGATTSPSCLPSSIKAVLNQIRSKFGPVTIVSTFRRGARIAGSGRPSYHASCRAVDFHPPKGKYSAVLAYLQRTHSGGLGTYSCGMHHLHIDNGPRIRFHHCVSSSGRIAKAKRRGKRSKGYASLKKGSAQGFVAPGQAKKSKKKRKTKKK